MSLHKPPSFPHTRSFCFTLSPFPVWTARSPQNIALVFEKLSWVLPPRAELCDILIAFHYFQQPSLLTSMSQSLEGMQAEIAHISSIYLCLSRNTREPPVRKQITQFSDPTTSHARLLTARHLIKLIGKTLPLYFTVYTWGKENNGFLFCAAWWILGLRLF